MKLRLSNFMSHDSTEVEFPARGVVVVTGHNGAGKSALIEGVSVALWGKGLRGRWSPWRPGVKGAVEINLTELNVERTWTGKAKGLKFTRPGLDVDYDTPTKAQDALQSLVGDHDSWRRTSVFSSSDAAHFTLATDAERKELLESMLGLGWFDVALDACRKDLKRARENAQAAKQQAQLLKSKVEGHQRALQSIVEVEETLNHEDVGDLKVEHARVRSMTQDALAEIAQLNERIRSASTIDGSYGEKLRRMQEELRKIDHDNCPTCGQSLDQTRRLALKAEIEGARSAVEQQKAGIARNTAGLHEQVNELEEEAAVFRERARAIDQHIREIEVSARQRALLAAQRGRAEAELDVDTGRYHQAIAEAKQYSIDVAELEAVESILGTRGIRAQVLGKTLSGIEGLANTWLDRLSSKITIELKSYTEKKTGGQVDSISLALHGAGGEHGYLGASAGERRRVDVALLLALAEIASSGPGAPVVSTPIFFDEVFDSLDVDGIEAVGEVLEELAKERCVVVVTHNADICRSVTHDLHLVVVDGFVVC